MSARWSTPSIALHWASALLLIGMMAAGFLMSDLEPDSNTKLLLARLHTAGGLSLMLLTLLRLIVRSRTIAPPELRLPPLHLRGIRIIHTMIYASIFALGASGVAMGQSSTWPEYLRGIESHAPQLGELGLRQVHESIVFLLLTLLLAHVGGVLVNQVRQGGTLSRMLPFDGAKSTSTKVESK